MDYFMALQFRKWRRRWQKARAALRALQRAADSHIFRFFIFPIFPRNDGVKTRNSVQVSLPLRLLSVHYSDIGLSRFESGVQRAERSILSLTFFIIAAVRLLPAPRRRRLAAAAFYTPSPSAAAFTARSAALMRSRTTGMAKPSPTAATIWPEEATDSSAATTAGG
jgi:hypothetical protein